MATYKETLNLPKTDFPMKANLAEREPIMLQRWHTLALYEKLMQQDRAQTFILHDGPPYANARPHMGTAMNKVLKDIIVKSKWLSGFKAPYVPGWDCHGLPIELNVEKKVGKAGDKVSIKAFRQACRDYAASQVTLQRDDFQRLGVLGDWSHPYLTMNFNYEANTVRALAEMLKQGHIVRGQKPVHWCPLCASALAEAEVEYKEKMSPSIDVAFVATEKKEGIRLIFPIWTTTPWTLPANEAVCVHPTLHYAYVKCDWHGEPTYFVLAKDLVDASMQRFGIDDYEVHGNVEGAQLAGTPLTHPFLEKTVPVVCGEHVTTEAGTGNVHTAPAHGLDDYNVGRQYDLPLDNPVNAKSCFNDDVPFVAGLHVYKANETILTLLADRGLLIHHHDLTHSYPHCWRHKTPLIFRATPQWFVSMDKKQLREKAIKEINASKWIPSWGEARIQKMVEGRPDWCISRQRTWGIPITFFIHRQTNEWHPDMVNLMEKIAQKMEEKGIDAWDDIQPSDFLEKDADQYEKTTDILDVWFDSGVTHYCVLNKRPELHVPADLYLEGSDQHRGWFQSSLLLGVGIYHQAPFKTVLTHGFVVDSKGRKMSKSLGNTILPFDIVKEFGADVLRLWAASMDYTNEVAVSKEILKRASDAYRRIRNTARFLLSNLNDFDPKTDLVKPDAMAELDQWAVIKAQALQEKIMEAYENYHFQAIYQLIHNYCSVDLGSFYLDIIKDRQYTAKQNSMARRSSQTAMYYIAHAFVRWIAPILSFTADEIWQYLPGAKEDSVFMTTWWADFPKFKKPNEVSAYWDWMSTVRDAVNKSLEVWRAEDKIGSALEAKVTLYAEKNILEKLARLGDELRFALIVSDANVDDIKKANSTAEKTDVEGLLVQIEKSEAPKCARCWQRRLDVGENKAHPELCGRCVVNVVGAGESRQFA